MGTITTIAIGTLVGVFVADVYEKAVAPAVNNLLKSVIGNKENTKKTTEN